MRAPRLETVLVAALTLLLVAVHLGDAGNGALQAVEGMALDQRFALRGPVAPGRDVAIVAIDDATLDALGRWPISRDVLAAAVRRIHAAGASVIAFDLLLVGSESAEADVALTAAAAEAGNVVMPYAFVLHGPVRDRAPGPAVARSAYRVVLSDKGGDAIPRASTLLAPLSPFLDAGETAHATVLLDADGHLRFTQPAIEFADRLYPSLAVTAARLHRGLAPDQVAVERGLDLRLGDRRFPTGPDLAQAIDYAGPAGSYPTWSLIDLLEDRVPAAGLAGRVVLIGATAAGVGDRFATPYDADMPGVEVFANAIDGLLGRGFLWRTPLTDALGLLQLLLAGLAVIALRLLRRSGWMLLGAAAMLATWFAVNQVAFAVGQMWLDIALPTLLIVVGSAIVIVGRGLRDGRLRRRLARYVSPLALAGGRRPVEHDQVAAVMFVDLVGFTHVGETLAPGEVAETLRGFHGRVERAASAYGGLVDNFIGDAALVVFGLGRAPAAAAREALAGARAIVAAIADWNAERADRGLPAIACGVGLHIGPVRVAEVGGATHAQITVTGDTVNVASRLEALTRELATTVIASDAVIDAAGPVGDFAALPPTALRGRAAPIGLWAWQAPG